MYLQSNIEKEQIMAFPQEARRAGREKPQQSGVRPGAPAKQPIPRNGSSGSVVARSEWRAIQRERESHGSQRPRRTAEHEDLSHHGRGSETDELDERADHRRADRGDPALTE